MSMFQIHLLDRFIGLDLLGSFMSLAKTDPEFTNSHDPKPVRFDKSVTIQYEGANLRMTGEEEQVFLLLKQGCFAMWIITPDPVLTFPAVTIFGDVRQAMLFLGDLRAHHDGLLKFRQGRSYKPAPSSPPV